MNKPGSSVLICILLCISILFCSAIWTKTTVSIDTENNHVFEYITADTLTASFSEDSDKAKKDYNDRYFLITGLFENEDSDSNIFRIMDQNMKTVTCRYSSKNTVKKADLSFRENVAVYGRCKVSFGKYEIVDVEKVVSAAAVRAPGQYCTLDGKSLDKASSLERDLNNGRIKYYIPSYYRNIEKNIKDEKAGMIEGYQYNLNLLEKDGTNEPEVLFVCYLDKKLLKEVSDIKRTNDVEKLMIQNIGKEKNISGFPLKKIRTYYDAEYQYYRGSFTTDLGTGYRTEYVFQKAGEDGILMYLYLYKEEKHISDIMLITRLLEIQ